MRKFTYCSAINKIGFAGLFSRSKDTASFNNVFTFYRSDKHNFIEFQTYLNNLQAKHYLRY